METVMSHTHANRHYGLTRDAITSVSLPVCEGRLINVELAAGDTLRVDAGIAWYTIDNVLEDFIVRAGEERRLERDTTLHLTGFGPTDVTLTSRRPQPRFATRGGLRPVARSRLGARIADWFREEAAALAHALRPTSSAHRG
jgi:hypothetical protein